MITENDKEILKIQDEYFKTINEELLLRCGWIEWVSPIPTNCKYYFLYRDSQYTDIYVYRNPLGIFQLQKRGTGGFARVVSSMRELDEQIQNWI